MVAGEEEGRGQGQGRQEAGDASRSVAEAREAQLDALNKLCTAVHEMKASMDALTDKVSAVNGAFGTVERKLDGVTLPFQSAVFDLHNASANASRTA